MRTREEMPACPVATTVQRIGSKWKLLILRNLLAREVVVQGNPRVYKALREQLERVLEELRRIESGAGVDADLLAVIRMIAQILDGMRDSAAP